MANDIKKSILSGILISMGCCIYLACCIKGLAWAGALLFSVGLYTICEYGFNLFTGKVGYIANRFSDKKYIGLTLLVLVVNLVTAFSLGALTSIALPDIAEYARTIYAAKLSCSPLTWCVNSYFCGVLMFIAVDCFRQGQKLGIFLAVPAFILAGFEHSIANMFYNGAALSQLTFTANNLLFTVVGICGNALGGMTIPLFTRKW